MAKILIRVVGLFLILFPAVVSAGSLDDHYLSRLAPQTQAVQLLGGIAALTGVAPSHAERSLTPVYHNLKRDWKLLESSTQKVLASQLARPTLLGEATFTSPGGHFTIHYTTNTLSTDALPSTPADQNGVPLWVLTVADVFDHVYGVEVTTMGFREPPATLCDVYLVDLTRQGAYGFTRDIYDPGVPPQNVTSVSVVSYIEIDKAFTDKMYTDVGNVFTYSPEQSLDVTAAHEFNHVLQFGYNYYFESWYAEMTATWMEDEVYDSVNQLYSYLSAYLPNTDTIAINASSTGLDQYGRWIYNRYLAETHAPALNQTAFVRDVWAKLGGVAAPADHTSEIPMLPVIMDTIADYHGTFGGVSGDLIGFAKKLYRGDWSTHPDDVSQGLISSTALALKATYRTYPVDTTAIATLAASLPAYTFAYYKFVPDLSAAADLTLTFSNVPAGVDIVAIKKGTDGSFAEYPLNRAAGTVTVPSFNTIATSEMQLVVCNSSATAGTVTASPAGSGGSGGGCFIATAAYGSYLHPKVAELRTFRDRYLLTNAPGRLFVACYYRLSPPVARVIARHEWMMAGVRAGLTPVVLAVEHPADALVLLFLSAGAVGGMLVRRRRGMLPCAGDYLA